MESFPPPTHTERQYIQRHAGTSGIPAVPVGWNVRTQMPLVASKSLRKAEPFPAANQQTCRTNCGKWASRGVFLCGLLIDRCVWPAGVYRSSRSGLRRHLGQCQMEMVAMIQALADSRVRVARPLVVCLAEVAGGQAHVLGGPRRNMFPPGQPASHWYSAAATARHISCSTPMQVAGRQPQSLAH